MNEELAVRLAPWPRQYYGAFSSHCRGLPKQRGWGALGSISVGQPLMLGKDACSRKRNLAAPRCKETRKAENTSMENCAVKLPSPPPGESSQPRG